MLPTLRLSLCADLLGFGRTFGATITSASGAIFAKGDAEGAGGVKEVIMMLAVEVGDRCSVSGCVFSACPEGALL